MFAQVRSRQIVGEAFLERLSQDFGFLDPGDQHQQFTGVADGGDAGGHSPGRHRDVGGPVGAVGGDGLGGEVHDPGM